MTKFGFAYYKNCVEGFLEQADKYKLDAVEADLKTVYKQFVDFKTNNAALILGMDKLQEYSFASY